MNTVVDCHLHANRSNEITYIFLGIYFLHNNDNSTIQDLSFYFIQYMCCAVKHCA